MNEVLAYAVGAASLFGVVAPNSGNQTILVKYGTEEQKRKWLIPLIEGKLESGFSMTEPDQPGSDPRSLRTTARRDGDEWIINGHKWFTSNGLRADFFIVMCRTEDAEGGSNASARMTQIIVPSDTRGVNIVRGITVWNVESDHCEIIYDNVRVPVDNQLGSRGSGHQAAQDRLGAGRVYHCMNSIGQMLRAFDLMVERAMAREVHGGLLETKQFIQGFIADSYIDIQAARLMTIHCAEKMAADVDARTDISAIKVFVPAAYDAGRRPCDPGVGRGRRVGRPAPRGDVPRGAHAAHRRRPRRGAQDPHRQERALAVPPRRRLGLRQLTGFRGAWARSGRAGGRQARSGWGGWVPVRSSPAFIGGGRGRGGRAGGGGRRRATRHPFPLPASRQARPSSSSVGPPTPGVRDAGKNVGIRKKNLGLPSKRGVP